MSTTVVVANNAGPNSGNYDGQSFTPNVPGPNGTGSVGTATTASVVSVAIGYPTSDTDDRVGTVYLHSGELDDPTDITNPATLVGASAGTSDANGTFGSGTYSRTFSFSGVTVQVATQYYIYFSNGQTIPYQDNTPYSGGVAIDDYGDATTQCLQFAVTMTVS